MKRQNKMSKTESEVQTPQINILDTLSKLPHCESWLCILGDSLKKWKHEALMLFPCNLNERGCNVGTVRKLI